MTSKPHDVTTIAVIGLGTIGMSWAAYFLGRGLTVRASDPDEMSFGRAADYISRAWSDLEELGLVVNGADKTAISFFNDAQEAVRSAQYVQENGPERIGLKSELMRQIDAVLPPDVVIGSSTSALSTTRFQARCRYPGRVITAHPFNPPHLVPLVELCGGEHTDALALQWARAFFLQLERKPIVLARETYGHVANRLQYVVYNEAVRLVLSGVVSAKDMDAAVTFGPGLRWSITGPFMTFHLAAGEKGVRGAFAHFDERDSQTTDRAGRIVLAADQKETIVDGIDKMAAGRSVKALNADRDRSLIAVIKALRQSGGALN